jgi:hypothetical protein
VGSNRFERATLGRQRMKPLLDAFVSMSRLEIIKDSAGRGGGRRQRRWRAAHRRYDIASSRLSRSEQVKKLAILLRERTP